MGLWTEFDRLAELSQKDVQVTCPVCLGKKRLPTVRPDIHLPCWMCFEQGTVEAQTLMVRAVVIPARESIDR